MKQRSILAVLWLSICLSISAQTQQGYVKTLGRPNQKGVALSGVSVRVKGGHNAVLSNAQGKFQLPMSGMKNGDAYQLQQVQKQGYELNESGIISRKYAFSDKVPLTIVMVSTKQLQADKQRIENKAYQMAEKNYKKKLAQLEAQKNQNLLTEEDYRQQLRTLQNWFGKYESLINDLADHYVHTDYDDLNTKEREINQYIENGQLEYADSLLRQIGVYKRIEDVSERLSKGQSLMSSAKKDLAKILKQQKKDAEYLYQLYTIALGRFDNDKARFYIKTRADLDTANVEWQLEAGQYFCEFVADYPKALSLITRGLHSAESKYGAQSEFVAKAYDVMAVVYEDMKNYHELLNAVQQSLNIRLNIYPEENLQIASCYCRMGGTYAMMGDFAKAKELLDKSLAIRKKALPELHYDMAESYYNLGYVAIYLGKYDEGMKLMQQAVDIMQALYGDQYIHVADSYHNMGYIYMFMGRTDKAEEYLKKGLSLRQRLFGDTHPDVAESKNGLGTLFYNGGKYQEALDYYQQALSTRQTVFGELNPAVAICYNNLSTIYVTLQDNEKGLEYCEKALRVHQQTSGERHPETGSTWLNLSQCYIELKDYDHAMNAARQALDILSSSQGETHPNVGECYNKLGVIYGDLRQFEKAEENHRKALDIRLANFGEKHTDTANSYQSLGYIRILQGCELEAIQFYEKALAIYQNTVGINHPNGKLCIENIDNCYTAYLNKHPNNKKVQSAYQLFKETYKQ